VLHLRLVKGRLIPARQGESAITVAWAKSGSHGLRKSFVRDRMPAATQAPLNAFDIEQNFRLLADDPAIHAVDAKLTPGSEPGEANLALTVSPQPRFDVYATVANSRSPSVGGIRYSGDATLRNAIFSGDLLSIDGGETNGLADGTVAYSTPFFTPSTFVDVRGLIDEAAVLDQAVRALAIRSREDSIEAGVSQRLIETPLLPKSDGTGWLPAQSLTLGVRLASHHSYTSLLGAPFSFSPGAVNGVAIVNVLRGTADYVVRDEHEVLALSGTASYGLSGTGSDIPGVVTPNPHFASILAQLNYARRLNTGGLEFRARLAAQQSTGPLYSTEQLSAGGQDTVRGYRENLLLADSGVIGSLELSCPVTLGHLACNAYSDSWRTVRLSVFTDGAYMRNHAGPQPTPEGLSSVGVGVTWAPSNALYARFTYGAALINAVETGPKDIQDQGIGFMVTVHPLAGLNLLR
jgi:hemolysin activation/secretion protein